MIDFIKKILKIIFNKNEKQDKMDPVDEFNQVEIKPTQKRTYKKKKIMTDTEKTFYNRLKVLLPDGYLLFPQINLQSIIDIEEKPRFKNELFRNIDYGIFDEKTLELKLLIELNDYYHNINNKTKNRDKKVKKLIKEAGYNLTSFWLNKPNKDEYIIYIFKTYLEEKGTHPTSNINEIFNNNILKDEEEIL